MDVAILILNVAFFTIVWGILIGVFDGPKLYGVYVQGHVDVRGIITFFCEGLYRYRWQAMIHAYLTSRVHGRSCIVQENIRIAAKSL